MNFQTCIQDKRRFAFTQEEYCTPETSRAQMERRRIMKLEKLFETISICMSSSERFTSE